MGWRASQSLRDRGEERLIFIAGSVKDTGTVDNYLAGTGEGTVGEDWPGRSLGRPRFGVLA